MFKARVIKRVVTSQEFSIEAETLTDLHKKISKKGTEANWDCLPTSNSESKEIIIEQLSIPGYKLVLDLNEPTENVFDLQESDIVEVFSFKELIAAGFEINTDSEDCNEMIFNNLDLNIEAILKLEKSNFNNKVVWVDSDMDFKFYSNGYTLPNEMIKKVFRKDS